MKKKILIGAICALTVIAAGAVWALSAGQLKTEPSHYGTAPKQQDLYLTVEKNSVTPTSLTYRIVNNTDKELYYGVAYEIEVYQNNGWRKFNVEASWIEIAVILAPHSSNEETIDWESIYGNLDRGTYRLIKTVGNDVLSDEFKIN